MPTGWANVILRRPATSDAAAPGKAAAAPAKGAKGAPPPVEEVKEVRPQTRWVLQPRESIELVVRFKASQVGKFERRILFGLMGSEREFELPVRSTCAYPQISQDYRNLFYRKVKSRGDNAFVQRQYVISAATFEFGPMLVGKSREGYNEGKCNDSAGRVRITNNGLFALHVDFTFKKDFENACFIVDGP
jgi:hydrocephalus-inducing protein